MAENVSSCTALELLAKKLKNARMERNLSIDDVSRIIAVPKNYLQSIEEGDFSFLPKVYILAFIKKYAVLLEVGNDATFEECKKELQLPGTPQLDVSVDTDSPLTGTLPDLLTTLRNFRLPVTLSSSLFSSKIGIALVVFVGLVVFFLIGKVFRASPRHSAVPVTQKIVKPVVNTGANNPPPNITPIPPPHSSESRMNSAAKTAHFDSTRSSSVHSGSAPVTPIVTVSDSKQWTKNGSFRPSSRHSPYRKVLIVRMMEDYSWVKVVADDSARVYAGGKFKKGEVLRYEARNKFWVNIGRPKYVELYLNGKKLPPSTDRILIIH